MGIIKGQSVLGSDDDSIGCEYAGVLTKVSLDVRGLIHGDRVMAFGVGLFTTGLIIVEPMWVKILDALSFDEAATMAAVYVTVIYSLIDKAQLEGGQSVLIHSGCGGVRQAIAMWMAEAGAREREYHIINRSIPRIFDTYVFLNSDIPVSVY